MGKNIFFSPGKIILSGEHSVVYGEPALVSAINLGITAIVVNEGRHQQKKSYLRHICKIFEKRCSNLNSLDVARFGVRKLNTDNLAIYIKSNLPKKSGLGSSAALAHAVILSLLNYYDIKISKEKIFELVLEAEAYIHKNSSGVDPSAVVFGGTQIFRKTENIFKRRKINNNYKFNFTLINSGVAKESTGEMVNIVRSKVHTNGSTLGKIKKIGKVTSSMIESINNKKFNPALLSKNQRLLEDLGVVGKKAKKIVSDIELAGGFAKITGAGGIKDGSGWLLTYFPNIDKLNSFLDKSTMESYKIEVK